MSVQLLMDACVKVMVTDHKNTIIVECSKLISANEVDSKQFLGHGKVKHRSLR